MSATNRGAVRNEKDYYVTPPQTVRDFLTAFLDKEPDLMLPDLYTLDPCAGGGPEEAMTYPLVLREFGVDKKDILTVDIRPDSRANIKADYLTLQLPDRPIDFICSNIPFSLAVEFITKALSDVRDGGYVAFLSRLNLFGAQKRLPFWQANMPKYTFVHTTRPGFRKTSGTDATEYSHFVWQKGLNRDYTQLYTI
jgi:hypothetical protein